MPAIIISLLGLVADLVQRGAKAYADAQKAHDDLVAAVESGLADAKSQLEKMKTDHASRMSAAQAQIDALK